MAEKKKVVDLFPDFEFRFFSINMDESTLEGIQGPVYTPSGKVLELEGTKTVGMETPDEIFHDGSAEVYDLADKEFSLEDKDRSGSKRKKVYGYVPCPKCDSRIPITSTKRPLKIKCPDCGKTGTLES